MLCISEIEKEIESLINQKNYNQAECKLDQYITDKSSLDFYNYGVKKYGLIADNQGFKKLKVAFLRSITLERIEPYLKIKSFKKRINLEIYFGDYNVIDQEIINEKSDLHKFDPDILIIFLCAEETCPNLIHSFQDLSSKQINKEIKYVLERIDRLLLSFREKSDAKIILHNFEIPPFPVFGIADTFKSNNQKDAFRTLNKKINNIIKKYDDVYVLDYDQVLSRYGKKNCFDEKYWFLAKSPISNTGLKALSDEYVRFFIPMLGLTKKCIILDLDNTLWGGIVGEKGVEGIKLGKNSTGNAYLDFQRELLKLHKKGFLLAVNSKNNYNDAIEVFDKHPDVILKKEHFASMKINWNNKKQNMQEIASDLNIDMNTFVFFDDNPIERELIKMELPQVHTVELPDNPFLYSQILRELPDFEMLSYSKEDMKRGRMYQDQIKRKKLKESSPSLEDFYQSLQMEAIIKKDDEQSLTRLAKMTQKINQFNLTTIRYSERDISKFLDSDKYHIYSLRLIDKFGDNGIVGEIIIEEEKDLWKINSFLMSCRVIGRTVETVFLWYIFREAEKNDIEVIRGEYIATEKNKPVEKVYDDHNFSLISKDNGATLWECKVADHKISKPEWIKIVDE